MPKLPKSVSRSTRAKASKPEVHPLGEHLAALLNPALLEKPPGLAEASQARFEPDSYDSDGDHPRGMTGAAATVESLKSMLELGDPNLRHARPWTPHRPPRPDKSEAAARSRSSRNTSPRATSPRRSASLSKAFPSMSAIRCCWRHRSGKTFTMAQVIEKTQRRR